MFPNGAELRKLERKTLKRISEIGEFGKLGDLQAAAKSEFAKINEHRGPVNVHLGFTLNILVRGDRGGVPVRRRVDLGALVDIESRGDAVKNASYSLTICKFADPARSPILRKLHFDYEPIRFRNRAEPKPSVHMQVCGKLSERHRKEGYTDSRLEAWYPHFEKPRIPLPPTSVALLLNWLLLEFQTDPDSQAVLRSAEWRKLVSEAERTVLRPYFDEAATFLKSSANATKPFTETHLYESTGS